MGKKKKKKIEREVIFIPAVTSAEKKCVMTLLPEIEHKTYYSGLDSRAKK